MIMKISKKKVFHSKLPSFKKKTIGKNLKALNEHSF